MSFRLAGLLAAATLGVYAQAPGSITTHPAALVGVAAFDRQQNVYSADGGFLGGGILAPPTCVPMKVTKVDSTGKSVFSNQGPYGCGFNHYFSDVTLDSAGNSYLAGRTGDTSFAAKLSADGSTFLYVKQLPAMMAQLSAIRLDAQGNVYVAGVTIDFHPVVLKLSADGSTVVYSVQLGGSGASIDHPDKALGLTVDSAGGVVITGQTSSADFPVTAGALQTQFPFATSAFVTRIDGRGKVIYSTLLGGPGGSNGQTVDTDAEGNVYVAGDAGAGFPTTQDSYQPVAIMPLWSTGPMAFVAKLKPDLSGIIWSTYFLANGVTLNSGPRPIQLVRGSSGDVYVASATSAGFVPPPSAPQPCFGGDGDTVVARFDARGAMADSTYLGVNGSYPASMSLTGDGQVLLAIPSNGGPQVVQVRFGEKGWTAPPCLSPVVLNAASFFGGISPGQLVSLTGFGIGPEVGTVYQPGSDGAVPRSLGGVQVFFNGIAAPLLYVQSRQVNAQVPFEVATFSTLTTKVAVTLVYNDRSFGPFTMESTWKGPPGIFRLHPGVSAQAAAINQDGTINGPSNPAERGQVVTFFGTGYGPLVPSCTSGGLNPPGPVPLLVTEAPIQFPVEYQGSAPTLLCGIAQFNFRVPLNVPVGELLLTPYVNPGYGSTIFVR